MSKIAIAANYFEMYFNPTHHGVFETSPVTGGTKRPPLIFFRKLYILWSFGG